LVAASEGRLDVEQRSPLRCCDSIELSGTVARMRNTSDAPQEEFVGLRFIHRGCGDPAAPLFILVHGRAGKAEVMWAFDRTIPERANVVSFEAFLPDALGGYSWWDMASDKPLEPEILRARDRLHFAIDRYIELLSLNPSIVIAFGFSQGSVLLSAALLTGALRLDGLAILAGFVSRVGDPSLIQGAPRVFVAHGTADEVLSVEKARKGVNRLRSCGLNVTFIEEEGVGHKVGIQGMRALKGWVDSVLAG
jgi:predicted esterase